MADAKRTDRLQVMLQPEEVSALDDWRFKARMPSRSAAVRELLRRGLAAEGYRIAAEPGQASGTFGILDRAMDGQSLAGRPKAGKD